MIAVSDTLVSDLLFEKKFCCDLKACKGACCIEGDAGAPLAPGEASKLEEILDKVTPYMNAEGLETIQKHGCSVVDEDGEEVTPLVGDKGACAFVTYRDGIAKCSIEAAWEEGKVDFQKPLSCHLYPIRLHTFGGVKALNYHNWELCKPACSLGEKLSLPVFRFLKKPIERAFGEDYFVEMEKAYELYNGISKK